MSKDNLRINERIRISPVRLIDDNNQQLGIVPVTEALERARQAGLDLVEVAPTSSPPVCRIMDYGKFLYQQKRKIKQNLKKQHTVVLKEIRLRPKTDEHDRDIKMHQAEKFLDKGHKVQFTMLFRGREMMFQQQAQDTMDYIVQSLQDKAKPERPPVLLGRRMTMVLVPVKQAEKSST
ncbi:MAG TPA: translation initiation factor IF-3 [Phycisphaerales bacterium]|nr:translation initiation factor IF-3 [Phycisphaerales bacterium]